MSLSWQNRVESVWLELEQELAAENAFGHTPLRFPVSDYGRLLQRMRRSLPMTVVEPENDPTRRLRPLRALRVDDFDNWVQALLEAWSLVGHVLGFYQERIVNEGYLASATQEISVRELLRMVDYQWFPGVAASALPAFLVSGAPAMPVPVEVPAKALIQGVPLGDQLPQLFETTHPLDGRAEWNRMPAWVEQLSILPLHTGADRTLDLAEGGGSLRAGDTLLVLPESFTGAPAGPTPAEADETTPPLVRMVEKSSKRKAQSRRAPKKTGAKVPARRQLLGFDQAATEVELTEPLDRAKPDRRLRIEQIFSFSHRAHLFGYDAPEWSKLSDAVRRRYAPVLGGVQDSADDGASWSDLNEGLPETAISSLLIAGPHLFAGTSGGLYRRPADPASGSWSLLRNGLGRLEIDALATPAEDREGHEIFLGTSKGQVYHSADGGDSWAPVQGRQTPGPGGLRAVFSRLWQRARKSVHLQPSPPVRATLPTGPVHVLLPVTRDGAPHLLAGTDQGAFSFRLPAGGWRPISRGLPAEDPSTGQAATPVRALVAEPGGGLLLGCSHGIFRSTDGGGCWSPAKRGLVSRDSDKDHDLPVSCLAAYQDSRRRSSVYFAGTDQGVFRTEDPQRGWSSASLGLIDPAPDAAAPPAVDSLVAHLDPRDLSHHVFAGTAAGLFRSADRGDSWGKVDSLDAGTEISALAADGVGRLFAASPFAGFSTDQWPGFHLEAGTIDLDRVYPSAVAGGWVVLQQPPSVGGALEAAFPILRSEQVEREDFELAATVTRLFVEDDGTLVTFDLRATRVAVGSRSLEPWRRQVPDLRPVAGSMVRVAPPLDPLPDDNRQLIVSGQRSRVRPAEGEWTTADGEPPADADAEVQALSWRRQDGRHYLVVRDRFGRRLEVTASSLDWRPAHEDDEVVGAVVRTAGGEKVLTPGRQETVVELGEQRTMEMAEVGTAKAKEGVDYSTLHLAEPLDLVLDPSSVTVWGNVASANQGQTISHPIGSGDASRALQRFPLSQPLTYVAAANTSGYRSTLEIKVAGATWTQVPHLADVAAGAHAFMVRPDLSGQPTVIFGDGVHGARLPTGNQNVFATYRTGMWPEALAPRQLSVLQTRPLGLRHVDNPLATEPGAPPEDHQAGRRRMPSWQRPMGRIVSLRDYQDFVRQRAEVSAALVAPLIVRRRPVIQITVKAVGGQKMTPGGERHRMLMEAIERYRCPGDPVRIDNYQPVRWLIRLRLAVDDEERATTLADQVRSVIRAHFSPAAADFGQRLFVGQVVELAYQVKGVRSAEAAGFGATSVGWSDDAADSDSLLSSARGGLLQAELAQVDASTGKVRPAQLLLIDEQSPVLEVVR